MEAMEAESSLERAMIARARETKTPINGSIELLPLCNMNCGMCYVRLSRQEMERQLNRLLLADVKGQVLEKSFTAAGGESLYVLTLRCRCLEDIAQVVSD